MKTAIKKVERAVANKDKDAANAALKTAIKSIDKATQNGVSSKNKSARNKARLTKKVNTME
jgi:small subunit ribosomal protein S20